MTALSSNRLLPMEWIKGEILEWNPVTLENLVVVDGTPMRNLAVLGLAEADAYGPGDIVGIVVVGGTYAVLGELVVPGTPQATDALKRFGGRIYSNFVLTGETCSSTTYTDLATLGPQVDVPVGPSGRILVIATAQIQWAGFTAAANVIGDGRFDLEFSRANIRSPNEAVDPLVGISRVNALVTANAISHAVRSSDTAQAVFSGLNPGLTTITMKYRKETDSTGDIEFFRRTLTVFKL